jgi:four helix bundle protein
MRKENILKTKIFEFALQIIKLYKGLTEKKEFILSKQILRSGTAIGALIRESENAAGKKDFLNKLTVALKEADETCYWLDLLYHSDYIDAERHDLLLSQCNELVSILTASVKTIKNTLLNSLF